MRKNIGFLFVLKKLIFITISVLVTSLLVYRFLQSIESEHPQRSFERITNAHYARRMRNADEKSVIFLGSSSIQALDVSKVAERAINLGIGGEKLAGLKARLANYPKANLANIVVLAAGFNDLCGTPLKQREMIFNEIIGFFDETKLVISSMQPAPSKKKCIDLQSQISEYNAFLKDVCRQHVRCEFVDLERALGSNTTHFFEADNIHLNPIGYRVWERELEKAISKLQGKAAK